MISDEKGSLLYSEKGLKEGRTIIRKRRIRPIFGTLYSFILFVALLLGILYEEDFIMRNIVIIGLGLCALFLLFILSLYSLLRVTALEIYEKGVVFPVSMLGLKPFINWNNIDRIYLNEIRKSQVIIVVLNMKKRKEIAFYVFKKHILDFPKFLDSVRSKIKIVNDVDAIISKKVIEIIK